jgi:hypothetical protein
MPLTENCQRIIKSESIRPIVMHLWPDRDVMGDFRRVMRLTARPWQMAASLPGTTGDWGN